MHPLSAYAVFPAASLCFRLYFVRNGSNPETSHGSFFQALCSLSLFDSLPFAGFAVGLQRPVTLLVGDVSFLHDVNGLNLLRTGEHWPPVTVVLVNNGGGGIFNFLPVADAVPEEDFTALWAMPQHVDLEGAKCCFHPMQGH